MRLLLPVLCLFLLTKCYADVFDDTRKSVETLLVHYVQTLKDHLYLGVKQGSQILNRFGLGTALNVEKLFLQNGPSRKSTRGTLDQIKARMNEIWAINKDLIAVVQEEAYKNLQNIAKDSSSVVSGEKTKEELHQRIENIINGHAMLQDAIGRKLSTELLDLLLPEREQTGLSHPEASSLRNYVKNHIHTIVQKLKQLVGIHAETLKSIIPEIEKTFAEATHGVADPGTMTSVINKFSQTFQSILSRAGDDILHMN